MMTDWDQDLWLSRVRSSIAHSSLAPVMRVERLKTHRSDHLLAVATSVKGNRWFVKAFTHAAESDYLAEVAIYQRFSSAGVVPTLQFADSQAMVICTDFVEGGRLGDLESVQVSAIVPSLAPLYAKITDPRPLAMPYGMANWALDQSWSVVADLAGFESLPEPAVVEGLLKGVPRHPIHGDFQPSNVLVGESGPLVVDFESYGPGIPATDIAKMSYNPLLAIEDTDRDALANEMLDVLAKHGIARVTPRQFAASVVLWAVSCAAYFQSVRTADPRTELAAPEVIPLSTRPLEFAATLWNRGF